MREDNLSELNSLIKLAETTSKEVEKLRNENLTHISRMIIGIMLTVGLSYLFVMFIIIIGDVERKSSGNEGSALLFMFLFICVCLILTYQSFYKWRGIRKKLYIESRSLLKLLSIIGPYKDSLTISPVKRATIEMRLSKIDYNYKHQIDD